MRFERFSALLLALSCTALGAQNIPASTAASQSAASQSAASQVPTGPPVAGAVAEAEALVSKQDWKNAEAKLAAWLSNHPDDARALFDAGYVADAQNKDQDAAAFYGRAVKADPKSFEAHLSLGLLLARQGKPQDARVELDEATKLDPGEAGPVLKAKAWRALARIDQKDDPAQASTELLEALKTSPETSSDTLLAAELAEATNQLTEAETAYRRVLHQDPKSAEATSGLGHVLLRQKKYPEAETLLRGALAQTPDDPTLTAELAEALVAQDKGDALPLLQKLHQAHPADENITGMLAEVLAESGDAAGSDALYVSLLAQHPKDAGMLVSHGQNLIRQQKYADAFAAFTQAADLDSSNPDAWSGLAFAASKVGKPSAALQALTMRSKYLPDNASTYFLRATSYDSLHDRAAAISSYHQFLQTSAGKYPDQEWQARQRLLVLEKKR